MRLVGYSLIVDIHQLTEQQQVEIDLSGLETDGITLGPGIYGAGEVTRVIFNDSKAVVRLSDPIAGKDEIEVSAERLTALS